MNMSISNAIGVGLQGMQNGLNRVDLAGARIAFGPVDAAQLAKNAVAQMEAAHEVKASANVVKAADEMLGTLLDIRA
jgi:hypothetical protein